MTRPLIFLLSASLILRSCSPAADYEEVFHVHASDHAMINAPVYVDLVNSGIDPDSFICLEARHEHVPGQIEVLDGSAIRIWWIVNLKAGETVSYGLIINDGCDAPEFHSERTERNSTGLFYNGRPVIRYEHPEFDPDDIENTKKPFHHVYDPSGNQLITKGPGGLYSHHRGIFFGYNHVYINDNRVDIWHANDGERSEHVEFTREFGGPVFGGHEARILWSDREGEPFLEELRDVRTFAQPEGEVLIEFTSTLQPVDGSVRLEGDRQHAGVQFRAAQYVADNPGQTRFIRPAAWQHVDQQKEIPEEFMHDLQWNAMHFMVAENSYTVAYLGHPANPPGAEMSERLYGRFGEFFPWHLTAANPLSVKYRFWITGDTAPSVKEIDLRYQAFAHPAIIVTDE